MWTETGTLQLNIYYILMHPVDRGRVVLLYLFILEGLLQLSHESLIDKQLKYCPD